MIINIEDYNGNTIGGAFVYENNENGDITIKDLKGKISIADIDYDTLFDTNDKMIRIQLEINHDTNIIKDLIKLKQLQEKQNQLWCFEDLMDDATDEYLEEVKELADKYELNYNDNYEDFKEDDDYEPECIILDRMAWHISFNLEDYLKKKMNLDW